MDNVLVHCPTLQRMEVLVTPLVPLWEKLFYIRRIDGVQQHMLPLASLSQFELSANRRLASRVFGFRIALGFGLRKMDTLRPESRYACCPLMLRATGFSLRL